jgi:hypothetical protein
MIKLDLTNCLLAFKPNNTVHESGFNCFDIAYYDYETHQYHIISDYLTDNIYFRYGTDTEGVQMDTKDGWVRLWRSFNLSSANTIKWSSPVSSVGIENITEEDKIFIIENS